jgi:hypothetical protein
MSFVILKSACDGFRTLLRQDTGRDLIDAVSVDEPKEPEDELHFLKLVSWCYVFMFEASQPSTKHILSLLRKANPESHRAISLTFETVNNLRTVRVHNLLAESRRDDQKRIQAHIWLLQNCGDPLDWPCCCRALSNEVTSAIDRLVEKWNQVTADKDDAASAVGDLMLAIDREWPPHAFDRMVETAANDIGLSGLDYVKYRQSRLKEWRELTGFFESRDHAEAAMSAAIRRELEHVFGNPTSKASESTIK